MDKSQTLYTPAIVVFSYEKKHSHVFLELSRYFSAEQLADKVNTVIRDFECRGKDVTDYQLLEQYIYDEETGRSSVRFFWTKYSG